MPALSRSVVGQLVTTTFTHFTMHDVKTKDFQKKSCPWPAGWCHMFLARLPCVPRKIVIWLKRTLPCCWAPSMFSEVGPAAAGLCCCYTLLLWVCCDICHNKMFEKLPFSQCTVFIQGSRELQRARQCFLCEEGLCRSIQLLYQGHR